MSTAEDAAADIVVEKETSAAKAERLAAEYGYEVDWCIEESWTIDDGSGRPEAVSSRDSGDTPFDNWVAISRSEAETCWPIYVDPLSSQQMELASWESGEHEDIGGGVLPSDSCSDEYQQIMDILQAAGNAVEEEVRTDYDEAWGTYLADKAVRYRLGDGGWDGGTYLIFPAGEVEDDEDARRSLINHVCGDHPGNYIRPTVELAGSLTVENDDSV